MWSWVPGQKHCIISANKHRERKKIQVSEEIYFRHDKKRKQYRLANHYSSQFCIGLLPDKLRCMWYLWSVVVSTSVGQIRQSRRDQSSQRLSPTSRVSRSWSRQRVLSVRQGLQSTTSALCDCFPTSLTSQSSHRHSRTGTFFHTCKFKVAYLTQVLLVKEMITALKRLLYTCLYLLYGYFYLSRTQLVKRGDLFLWANDIWN